MCLQNDSEIVKENQGISRQNLCEKSVHLVASPDRGLPVKVTLSPLDDVSVSVMCVG